MEKEAIDNQYFDYSKETLQTDYVSEHDTTVFLKSPEEKAFVRKLNWTVLPIIFLIVFIQFCDKSALSVAAVLGIMEDNNISLDQFSWVGSIFYLGYLICQLPNNYLIQRLPTGRYLGSVLIIWGFVMGLTSLCHNFKQLMILRFLLGLFEGVTYPCVYIVLNTLYRRSEQSACWGFLGISTGMGTVFGVLIAYGLYYMDNIAGLRAWRWGYIVFGIGTVLIGILTFFYLVDDTHHKLLRLTEKELEIVEERTRDNCVVRVKEVKTEQMWEAMNEPRLYLIFFMNLFNCLQNGGLVTFSTLLVQGLGFSSFTSIILQIPNGIISAIFAIGAVWVSMRVKHITFTAIGTACISLLGCILLSTIPGTPKLLGLYLSWGMTGVGSLTQTLVSNNVSGYTKRIFYNAISMVAMTVGNFIGPLMMVGKQAPEYSGAMIGFSIANAALIGCLIINYIIMKRENKRRLDDPPATPTDVYLDLTDKQDRNILYKL